MEDLTEYGKEQWLKGYISALMEVKIKISQNKSTNFNVKCYKESLLYEINEMAEDKK